MNKLKKCIYPTGKIFVSCCTDADGDDFSRFNLTAFGQAYPNCQKVSSQITAFDVKCFGIKMIVANKR
ncbi:hypothetical protein CWI76_10125 [Pseudidiomarina marina]|uniref:Uncharacterized protein n=1 Tax=Pseudidiomarina marina TaxID=502366 RepID=A0A432YCS1_9GAMM|nr:hypothetical protein CWI76_10125 [Pseudidiomarina marina]